MGNHMAAARRRCVGQKNMSNYLIHFISQIHFNIKIFIIPSDIESRYNKLGIFMPQKLQLLFATTLLFHFSVCAQDKIERPTVQFNGETYYLADYDVGFSSNSQIEVYYPKDSDNNNWTKQLSREHLFDVTNLNHAVAGFADNYKSYQLPFERIKSNDSKDIILKVTYYSPVHPIIIDKKIVILKSFLTVVALHFIPTLKEALMTQKSLILKHCKIIKKII